jgi:hypothetical protein
MLTQFTIEHTFYNLRMTLYVDTKQRNASLTVTYDRYIRHMGDIPFHEVSTPDLAEKWFSRPCGERGNFIEFMEWRCRTEPREQTAA